MKPRLVWLAAACLVLTGTALAAQERTLTGTVTDSATGDPIASVTIAIQGTRLVTHTKDNGAFILTNVSDADVTLQVRYIGYRKRDVRVSAGESVVDVALARDIFKLEEIVVSGQATGIERKNLANAVAVVTSDDINSTPSASVEQQLVGKVAGADIQSNSGAPGGGLQMRLRGTTSINATAEPLYVVDGIVVSDVAIPSNQNAVTKAAAGGNTSPDQDAQVNRIADVNPNDIESIEILKGASASAIYGGRASNGVVIITTKRGRVGKPVVSLTQRFGFSELARDGRLAKVRDCGRGGRQIRGGDRGGQRTIRPAWRSIWRSSWPTGSRWRTRPAISLSGGGEGTQYYLSGQVQNTPGIIDNTGFQRQSVRLNLDQQVSPRLHFGLTSNVLHTLANRGLTNNDNSGTSYYVVLSSTPSFANLQRRSDGSFRNNPFVPSNPLQTAALAEMTRMCGGSCRPGRLISTYSPTPDSPSSSSGGADSTSSIRTTRSSSRPICSSSPTTRSWAPSLLKESNNLSLNLDIDAVHSLTPSSGSWTATTSVGIQHTRRTLNVLQNEGYNLVGGQQNIDAATRKVVLRNRDLRKSLGYFLQEEFLALQDRLLLTCRHSRRPEQPECRCEQAVLVSQGGGIVPIPEAGQLRRRVQAAAGLRRVRSGTRLRPEVHPTRCHQERRRVAGHRGAGDPWSSGSPPRT